MKVPGKPPKETSRTFSRSQRVRKAAEFKKVFEKGSLARGRWFNVRVLLDETPLPPRLGLVISSKTAPRAVDRNRWKRRLREVFRMLPQAVKNGCWVVVQARPNPRVPEMQEAEQEFLELLFRLKALKEKS